MNFLHHFIIDSSGTNEIDCTMLILWARSFTCFGTDAT